MEDWTEIRRRVLVEGVSRRQILRETGMHRQTLKKILEHSEPPGYRQQQPRPRKKLGAFVERIKQILKEDQAMPRKQRHTAKRIWSRLSFLAVQARMANNAQMIKTRVNCRARPETDAKTAN